VHHRHFKRVGATALLAIAGLLGSLLIAPAAPASTINACQAKKGGAIRVITSKAKCKKTEKKIKWNTTGSAGKNGTNGSNGTNGTNGSNGAAGATGLPGQPQKSFQFSVTGDTANSTFVPLFSAGGVNYEFNCSFILVADGTGIFATPSAAGTALAGGIIERPGGAAVTTDPQQVFNTDLPAGTATNITPQLTTTSPPSITTHGYWTATVMTPSATTYLTAYQSVSGTGPTACTITGSAFSVAT